MESYFESDTTVLFLSKNDWLLLLLLKLNVRLMILFPLISVAPFEKLNSDVSVSFRPCVAIAPAPPTTPAICRALPSIFGVRTTSSKSLLFVVKIRAPLEVLISRFPLSNLLKKKPILLLSCFLLISRIAFATSASSLLTSTSSFPSHSSFRFSLPPSAYRFLAVEFDLNNRALFAPPCWPNIFDDDDDDDDIMPSLFLIVVFACTLLRYFRVLNWL